MNMIKLKNSLFYTQDMIKVFTDYGNKLDKYFSEERNINEHLALYGYYKDLKEELQKLAIKHKVVKK